MLANPLVAPIIPAEISYASGSFPVERTESPSGRSTRSRRSNGSSSDEDPIPGWDGFLEEDLRAGGPHLCEAPCETIHRLPGNHPNFDALAGDSIMEIGRQEQLEILEIHFCGRRSVFQRGQDPRLTVLLLAIRRDLSERGWIHIARKIRYDLLRRGVGEITVEIIDPRFGRRPRLFPCSPDDAIFPLWERVGESILNTLDLTGLLTIGCYRIGVSEDRIQCPPTILLGVDRQIRRNWKDAPEAVVWVLDSFGLSTVGVLIRKDASVFKIDRQSTPTAASGGNLTREVHLGYSICPHQMKHGQRTLGGWIELRNPQSGKWVPFGITCSHCVFPPDTDLSPEDIQIVQGWRQKGVPFNDQKASRLLIMDSPSRRAVKNEIEDIGKLMDEYEKEPVFQQVEDANLRGDFVIPKDERQWKIASDMLANLKQQRDAAKEFFHKNHFVLGPVMVASGLKEKPLKTALARDPTALLSIIDWALIKPQNRSVGTNNVPAHHSLGVSKLTGFSLRGIQTDKQLFKVGCATGFTGGIYNGLKTAHIATRLVNSREVKIHTWEHTILVKSHSQSFVEEGDSGSLVFDRLGAVAGMCFGGTYYGDIGYFTHAADLVESIQEVTGVREIRLRGEDE